MRSIMIVGAAALLLVVGGITTGEKARAAADKAPARSADGQRAEVLTVSGSVQITRIIPPEECPPCAELQSPPFVCFAGSLTGDLSGSFQSAMFENPFLPPDNAPEVAILEACSILTLDENSAPRLRGKTLESEDHIFARKSADPTGLGFNAVGELLTVVGGNCQGLVTLLGDALNVAPYVGRLICLPHQEGRPRHDR